MRTFLITFIFVGFLTSCKKDSAEVHKENKTEELSPLSEIEIAHKKDKFLSHEAIEFDIVINFGGNQIMDAKMTYLTNSTKGKIELSDSTEIVYHGNKVFYSPDLQNPGGVRFSAYTFMYFFLFPYKLTDSGTNWTDVKIGSLNGKEYNTRKLTFDSNIGDSPDDWYFTYFNPDTNLIDYAAYIVTFGAEKEEAEQDPHAIEYSDYEEVDGIPLAKNWTFWGWTETDGLTNKLGDAQLSNFKFLELEDSFFNIPEGFIEKEN